MLRNFPPQIRGKSQFLSSCVKPITSFYTDVDFIIELTYMKKVIGCDSGFTHQVGCIWFKEYSSFGENSQILAICTMVITWISVICFTMKCHYFFSPELFKKDHSYPTNKTLKICWGALSTIDVSKVPIGGWML